MGRSYADLPCRQIWVSPLAELRHYRYFVEIARRGTFTAAAEALNMTQSALSEQILQFERECGSVLFHRGRSGITLTPAGEYLLPQAQSLLAKAAETREGLAVFSHGYRDRLRVGAVLGPLQSWLPAALAQFALMEPHVQLQVDHIPSVNETLTGVAGGHLDVGVVSLTPSAPASSRHGELSQVVLVDEELVAVVPAGHVLAQVAQVAQSDLRDAHLVTFPAGYNLRRIIDEWYGRGGYAPIVAAETPALEVTLELVAAGVGVAILPRSLASLGVSFALRSVPLPPEDRPHRVVAAVHRREPRQPDLVRALVELLQAHAREAGGTGSHAAPAPSVSLEFEG